MLLLCARPHPGSPSGRTTEDTTRGEDSWVGAWTRAPKNCSTAPTCCWRGLRRGFAALKLTKLLHYLLKLLKVFSERLNLLPLSATRLPAHLARNDEVVRRQIRPG